MKKKWMLLFLCISLLSFRGYGHCGCDASNCPCPSDCATDCCCGPAFVTVGGGWGWSTKNHLKVNTNFFDVAPEGYNDDMGGSEFYTLGFGYHFGCALSGVLDVTYRPHFQYKRHQSTVEGNLFGPKTRHFKLSSLDFMFSLYVNKGGDGWCYPCGCMRVYPFVGGGLGVAYNHVSEFHSTLNRGGPFSPVVTSLMDDHTRRSFAGQVMVGIGSAITRCLNLELGYRRFWAGRFESNDYLLNPPPGLLRPRSVSPWKGWLTTNEIYLSLDYRM